MEFKSDKMTETSFGRVMNDINFCNELDILFDLYSDEDENSDLYQNDELLLLNIKEKYKKYKDKDFDYLLEILEILKNN